MSLPCMMCRENKKETAFLESRSEFFPTKYLSICTECLEELIDDNEGSLGFMDNMCRWMDVPFVPARWIEYYEVNGASALPAYYKTVISEEYDKVDWKETEEEYRQLKEKKSLSSTIPLITDDEMEKLQEKWGMEYSPEEIKYLEDFYQGLLQTYPINGKLQMDDAYKLCKISLIIDQKIRAGDDFDKALKSYDALRKSAGFTEKNIKNACDFDSVGELFAFCESKGWLNEYYDDTPRDQVDLVMKDTQTWIRNLYKNESGIGEDVDRRIEALKVADAMEESIMAIEDEQTLDEFDTMGYQEEEFDEEAGM